ncbi:MAG: transcriptional regulator NrdR [Candidatus Eisenbacteria bacterium]
MKCPKCQHDEDRVLETRVTGDGASIRRRRQCLSCSHRFTTYEYVESAAIEVVKRDGRREPFQRQKIERGLIRACEKRPIARETIQELVDRLERDFFRSGQLEAHSIDIGRRVMEALQQLDPVAYVRFASVYLNFNDASQFVETIQSLAAGTESGRSSRRSPSGRGAFSATDVSPGASLDATPGVPPDDAAVAAPKTAVTQPVATPKNAVAERDDSMEPTTA